VEEKLLEHSFTLQRDNLTLRPMTENDWDILLKWNSDPEVLFYVDGRDIEAYTMEEMLEIYRGVSHTPAYCFIAELDNKPIGECWLQKMNLERYTEETSEKDIRRIDLMIGEKDLWGKGIGTLMIGMLTKFGFENENADLIFGCDIGGYNPRSRRAFEKNGYELYQVIQQENDSKADVCWDMMITRDGYFSCLTHCGRKLGV